MPSCDAIHRNWDKIANGDVQVGELPDSFRIRGRVAWYVYAGPYRDLRDKGWRTFMQKVRVANLRPHGPPGDVYVCDPEDQTGERERSMITILYAPMDKPGRKA